MAEVVVVFNGGEADCAGGGEDLNAVAPAAAVELVPLPLLRLWPREGVSESGVERGFER